MKFPTGNNYLLVYFVFRSFLLGLSQIYCELSLDMLVLYYYVVYIIRV